MSGWRVLRQRLPDGPAPDYRAVLVGSPSRRMALQSIAGRFSAEWDYGGRRRGVDFAFLGETSAVAEPGDGDFKPEGEVVTAGRTGSWRDQPPWGRDRGAQGVTQAVNKKSTAQGTAKAARSILASAGSGVDVEKGSRWEDASSAPSDQKLLCLV